MYNCKLPDCVWNDTCHIVDVDVITELRVLIVLCPKLTG